MTKCLTEYKKIIRGMGLDVVGVEYGGKHGEMTVRAADGRTTIVRFHLGTFRDGPSHRQNIETMLKRFKEQAT